MMGFLIFIAGAWVGCFIGVAIMAIVVSGKRADERDAVERAVAAERERCIRKVKEWAGDCIDPLIQHDRDDIVEALEGEER